MLKELIAKAAKGKLFLRFCDDAYHQCMTVLSTRDWGERNTGVFNDEPDTVAITFHQLGPSVGCEAPNFNDDNARLLVALWNHREAIAELIEAAKAEDMPRIRKALEGLND